MWSELPVRDEREARGRWAVHLRVLQLPKPAAGRQGSVRGLSHSAEDARRRGARCDRSGGVHRGASTIARSPSWRASRRGRDGMAPPASSRWSCTALRAAPDRSHRRAPRRPDCDHAEGRTTVKLCSKSVRPARAVNSPVGSLHLCFRDKALAGWARGHRYRWPHRCRVRLSAPRSEGARSQLPPCRLGMPHHPSGPGTRLPASVQDGPLWRSPP